MNGYDSIAEVKAVLEALKHEKKGAGWTAGAGADYNPAHLASILEQEKVFEAELARMLAAGVKDEPNEPIHKSWGRTRAGNIGHQYPDSMKR